MGRPAGWVTTKTGRAAMRSPGRPPIRRDLERSFWLLVAEGLTSEDAAIACGVSGPVGSRWFRDSGGMPLIELRPGSGRYLSFAEREEIALLRAVGSGIREIARRVGRSPSTISRELRRNAATRSGRLEYRASIAQWKAELVARRPKEARLVVNERLRSYVQDRLSGAVRADSGDVVLGPTVPEWKGRNKPHRQDRPWFTSWSPEQIAHRLPIDFPDDPSMRISHEAIYQALYVETRGALSRHLVQCLRTGRSLRVPRSRARRRAAGHVTPETLISNRPAEVAGRKVAGHWEGDLIIGTERSAIATIVERSTRFTMLVHLPRMVGHGIIAPTKNGPALSGYGAEATKGAIAARMLAVPQDLRRSLTWDRGKELAQHAALKDQTGMAIFFADPHSPWQRATNENTNGLLRQYFPKGTDLARWSATEIDSVATALNHRPRRCLGWRTPAEAMHDQLESSDQHGVASTG